MRRVHGLSQIGCSTQKLLWVIKSCYLCTRWLQSSKKYLYLCYYVNLDSIWFTLFCPILLLSTLTEANPIGILASRRFSWT